MEYNQELREIIKNEVVVSAGSEEELEIRAGTVIAVEKIKEYFKTKCVELNSIEIDWLLW